MKDESITDHDLMDPSFNFWVASNYVSYNLQRYDTDVCKAVSAYNAGHANKWNKRYVKKVKERVRKYERYIRTKRRLRGYFIP